METQSALSCVLSTNSRIIGVRAVSSTCSSYRDTGRKPSLEKLPQRSADGQAVTQSVLSLHGAYSSSIQYGKAPSATVVRSARSARRSSPQWQPERLAQMMPFRRKVAFLAERAGAGQSSAADLHRGIKRNERGVVRRNYVAIPPCSPLRKGSSPRDRPSQIRWQW